MITLKITALFASLLAILFVYLTGYVIKLRRKHKVGIGDGGHSDLAKAIRVQGNFIECVPLALILLGAYEINGGNEMWLYGLGAMLFIGRILHAIGLSKTKGVSQQRVTGMLLTFAVLLVGAVLNLINFL